LACMRGSCMVGSTVKGIYGSWIVILGGS
jgi:hypothetical protein